MIRSRNYKLSYYSLGLISLILLPVFCIYYLYSQHAFDNLSVIEFIVPREKNMEDYFYPSLSHYKYIVLTGDSQHDQLKIVEAKALIIELLECKDTTTLIAIMFNESQNTGHLYRLLI